MTQITGSSGLLSPRPTDDRDFLVSQDMVFCIIVHLRTSDWNLLQATHVFYSRPTDLLLHTSLHTLIRVAAYLGHIALSFRCRTARLGTSILIQQYSIKVLVRIHLHPSDDNVSASAISESYVGYRMMIQHNFNLCRKTQRKHLNSHRKEINQLL